MVVIKKEKEFKCVICGEKFGGYGNNPWPIKQRGRCCDDCNNYVIMARLVMLRKEDKKNA